MNPIAEIGYFSHIMHGISAKMENVTHTKYIISNIVTGMDNTLHFVIGLGSAVHT